MKLCEWEDDPNDPEKLRCKFGCGTRIPIRLKGKQVTSECRTLSNFQKAKNYTKHFIQHKWCGSKEASKNLIQIRRDICQGCRHKNEIDNSCLYCGCPILEKTTWLEQQCPVYKWPMTKNLLYKHNNEPVNLENLYQGATCFFIGAGPSLNNVDLSQFSRRGIFTFAVNNIAARNIKPNFWCSADDPKSFHENIWRDPTILKFVRRNNYGKNIRTKECVRKFPGVLYFDTNEDFDVNTFLTEPTICFGNHSHTTDAYGNKGGRCVMLLSLRLMYYLGFKYIYLVGCDFHMNEQQPYAFEQHKWAGGVATNNDKFRIINDRLTQLRPKLEEAGVTIKNCTPNSKLTAFEYKDLQTVLGNQFEKFDENPNLQNMYGENKND